MNIESMLRICEQFTLQFPIYNTVKMWWKQDPLDEHIQLVVQAMVPDRATGERTLVSMVTTVDQHDLTVDRAVGYLSAFIRRALVEFMEHEMEEMLLLNGTRLKEPHS